MSAGDLRIGIRSSTLLGCVYRLWCAESVRFDPKTAELSTAEEFRLALRIAPGEANTLAELAIYLPERLPSILESMRDGLIDFWRAEQAHEVFVSLSTEDAAAAGQRVAERVRREGLPLVWRDYLRRVADGIDRQAKERRGARLAEPVCVVSGRW